MYICMYVCRGSVDDWHVCMYICMYVCRGSVDGRKHLGTIMVRVEVKGMVIFISGVGLPS